MLILIYLTYSVYITLRSKLYCSEVISIYIRHFERWPLLSMKRDSYYVIGRQENCCRHVIEISQWQASLQLSLSLS